MTWEQALLAFAAFSAVVTVTPGPDTILVLKSGLAHGRTSALAVSTGAATSSLAWGVTVAAGTPEDLRKLAAALDDITSFRSPGPGDG